MTDKIDVPVIPIYRTGGPPIILPTWFWAGLWSLIAALLVLGTALIIRDWRRDRKERL